MILDEKQNIAFSVSRCTGRRVWRVSVPTDEWSCVPNSIPFPWLRKHVRDHDATETQELGQVHP